MASTLCPSRPIENSIPSRRLGPRQQVQILRKTRIYAGGVKTTEARDSYRVAFTRSRLFAVQIIPALLRAESPHATVFGHRCQRVVANAGGLLIAIQLV
jgi:hypothetical protein